MELKEGDVLVILDDESLSEKGILPVLTDIIETFSDENYPILVVYKNEVSEELGLTEDVHTFEKSTDDNSAFAADGFHDLLVELNAKRVFVGGYGTETAIKDTVVDAKHLGLEVVLLVDGIVAKNDAEGLKAFEELYKSGVSLERSAL